MMKFPYHTHMPPKEDWITPKVALRNNSLAGKGLFAVETIKEGEEVVKWGGMYVHSQEAARAKAQGKHVMQFDDDLYSVEDAGDSDAYFVNHSCDPNLWMKDTFTLQAKRDINKGEEITADYAMWEADENYVSTWECRCGSTDCRHRVTGKDWMLPELQEKYRNHFIPLINRRIEKTEGRD